MQETTGDPKTALRLEVKKYLASVSEERLVEKSEQAYHYLKTFLDSTDTQHLAQHSKSIVVGGYAPIAGEVDWTKLEDGFDVAYPSFFENKMVFRKAKFNELLVTKEFGVSIRTPKSDHELVKPDVLLIPGLAFSPEGQRLGRGKGFYDRYLQDYTGLKVGVCFVEQLRSAVPVEEHDVMMDHVVCDQGLCPLGSTSSIQRGGR